MEWTEILKDTEGRARLHDMTRREHAKVMAKPHVLKRHREGHWRLCDINHRGHGKVLIAEWNIMRF